MVGLRSASLVARIVAPPRGSAHIRTGGGVVQGPSFSLVADFLKTSDSLSRLRKGERRPFKPNLSLPARATFTGR
jgi:hypothetical protein